jgi:hypothetical protein
VEWSGPCLERWGLLFSDTIETIDMTIKGGVVKKVEIYLLDWDNQSRTVKVEALDGDSGTVLNT